MDYYKQFNVVMNALDNRGEAASICYTRGHLFATGGGWKGHTVTLALTVFVNCPLTG